MNKVLGIIVLIIIIAGGYFFFFADNGTQDGAMEDTTQGGAMENGDNMDDSMGGEGSTEGDSMEGGDSMSTEEDEVVYTEDGFEPETITVSPGTTVVFTNESGNDMWVASDVHPTHTEYHGTSLRDHCPDADGVAFDQCEAGDTYSFTFDQEGEWDYHNHRRAQDTGAIIVQ